MCLNKIIPTLVNHAGTPEQPEQKPADGLGRETEQQVDSNDSDRDHQFHRVEPSIEAAIQHLRPRVDAFLLRDKLHFVARLNQDTQPSIKH